LEHFFFDLGAEYSLVRDELPDEEEEEELDLLVLELELFLPELAGAEPEAE